MAFVLKSAEKSSVVLQGNFLLDNNTTFYIGDLVAFGGTAGVITNATASVTVPKQLVGVIESFVNAQGQPLVDSQGKPLTQITTPSNNTTAKIYYAKIIPVYPELVWEADVNADLGTTAGSNQPGGYFAAADARTIAENSFVLANNTAAPKMFFSRGPSIDPSTGMPARRKVLVHVVQSVWAL